jgi:hypothetical protein
MNYPHRITAIVTGLPPKVDGVGDYAWHLSQQIRKDFGINTEFLASNSDWQPTPEFNEFTAFLVSIWDKMGMVSKVG